MLIKCIPYYTLSLAACQTLETPSQSPGKQLLQGTTSPVIPPRSAGILPAHMSPPSGLASCRRDAGGTNPLEVWMARWAETVNARTPLYPIRRLVMRIRPRLSVIMDEGLPR